MKKAFVDKLTINKQLKSKRFIAVCGSTIMFSLMIYTTPYSPIELATAISMILTIYTGAETLRPSNIEDKDKK